MEIPEGAAPAGTTITVEARDASERPAELKVVPMASTWFELQPSDARFGAPVTVTRSIGFEELGTDTFDPVFDGLVVGSLFTQDASGRGRGSLTPRSGPTWGMRPSP